MDIKEYLERVAYIGDSTIPDDRGKVYYSKFDSSFITRVGMEDEVIFLADLEVLFELSHGVGFSSKHNMWFGWCQRGIRGFTIGSTIEKGYPGYIPANIEDAMEEHLSFWEDEDHEWTKVTTLNTPILKASLKQEGDYNIRADLPVIIRVSWKYSEDYENERLRGLEEHQDYEYTNEDFGRGEWEAKTMSDAKQMAIDFYNDLS